MSALRLGRHAFTKGPRQAERCNMRVPGGGLRERCGLKWSNPLHRFYQCGECKREDFASVEMRDRHEADEHGSGW